MKKFGKFIRGAALAPGLAALAVALSASLAPGAQGAPEDMAQGEAAVAAAQEDLQKAEKDFGKAAKGEGVSGASTWSQVSEGANAAAQGGSAAARKAQGGVEISRNVAPGYDGYMGTYVDPANGDIVTSVIAPTRRDQPQQSYPMIIEPQVGAWGNSGWNGGSYDGWRNNWQNGWHGPGQQVPGYPWPPAQPGFQPSGQVPGYPWPPAPEGYGPPPPPPGQAQAYPGGFAPGAAPGYAPPGQIPGQPYPGGSIPPLQPGMQPGGQPGANPPPLQPVPSAPAAPAQPMPGMPNVPGQPPQTPVNPAAPANPGGLAPQDPGAFAPAYAPPAVPGQMQRPWPGGSAGMPGAPGFSGAPGWRRGPGRSMAPGATPGSGGSGVIRTRPRSELAPPKNPARPGSMPLVAPNFPPHVETKPFEDLYRPPLARASRQAPGATAAASERREPSPYYVPGSAQSWQPSNWRAGD